MTGNETAGGAGTEFCDPSVTGAACNDSAANASTIAAGERTIVVEQGPPWLAEALYAPPAWANWLATAALLVALVGIGYAIHRAEIEDYGAFVGEVGEELLVVGCVAGGAAVLAETASLPYWMDVLAGCTMGYCVSQTILRGLPAVLPGETAMADGSKD